MLQNCPSRCSYIVQFSWSSHSQQGSGLVFLQSSHPHDDTIQHNSSFRCLWSLPDYRQGSFGHRSNHVFVTSQLANTLKAKKDPSPLIITGIRGGVHCEHTVCLTLYNNHNSSLNPLHVRAHVVHSIVPDVPAQDLHFLILQPFLQDKELADPYFDPIGRIDLLLGMMPTNLCLLQGRASSSCHPNV